MIRFDVVPRTIESSTAMRRLPLIERGSGLSFSITPAGARAGLEWVLVEPRGAEADFRSALFGFAHGDLKRLILEDRLGQTATIGFEKIERNGPVAPGEVSFTPPAGTDVIGTPRK